MPRRIVVIDDNADAAESVAMLLRLKGHEVHITYDGDAGVSAALKTACDCVIVDIGLPGIDGYEVARRLRSHDHDHRLMLIALTGYGQPEDIMRSAEAGFDHHLVKPVAQEVLETDPAPAIGDPRTLSPSSVSLRSGPRADQCGAGGGRGRGGRGASPKCKSTIPGCSRSLCLPSKGRAS